MRQMPHNHPYFDPRPRMPQYRQAPRPRSRRFRWGIVWMVLAILACVWLLNGINVPFEWEDVMRALHVSRRAHDRYTRLAVLGVALICVCTVYRALRRSGRRNW